MWQEKLFLAALLGTICCLFCLFVWIRRNPTVNSTTISLSIWIGFGFLMLFIEPFIFSPTKNLSLDRFIWYGSFSLLDFLALASINTLHKKHKIKLNRDSIILCLSLFCLLLLQVGRYLDKQVFEVNILADLYKNGVPTINIITWSYILTIIVLNKAKKNKKSKGCNV